MGFRINTNIPSLNAQKTSKKVAREKEESLAKLSSGERITKAADDAAGLAISEKLKAEIRSSKQANRNANDGLALVQTAEGGLSETSSILTRMRELSVQSATDSLDDNDRAKSEIEYQQLKSELERISQVTEFNGKKLLNGTGDTLTFQVGVGADSADDHISYDAKKLNAGSDSLGVSHLSVSSKLTAQDGLARLDRAIDKVSGHRALLGSIQNRLNTSSNNLLVYNENMNQANSRIRDVDYADESANIAKSDILSDANTAVLAQANVSPQAAVKLLN